MKEGKKTNTIIGRASDYIDFLEKLSGFINSGDEFIQVRSVGIPTFLEWEDGDCNAILFSTGGPRSNDDFESPLGQVKIEKSLLNDFAAGIKFIGDAVKVNPFSPIIYPFFAEIFSFFLV